MSAWPGEAAGAPDDGESLLRLIAERRSVRAFSPRPVGKAVIRAILDVARWAPSGANTQPWDIHILCGTTKRRITEHLQAARRSGAPERGDYQYYPTQWFDPYKSRRVGMGISIYRAYGAARSAEAREANWARNYDFFGAPVGMMFFIHRDLATGSWVDYGMLIQNIMLAARAHGLETCPQASLAEYPDIVRDILGIEPTRSLLGGLSLGYPDWQAPINRFERSRVDVAGFAVFHE